LAKVESNPAEEGVVKRRIPRWSELKPMFGVAAPRLTRESRVAAAPAIEDLRALARRRTPRAVFDYVDGGAGYEESLNRSRRAFRSVEFHPQVLNDVSSVDTSAWVVGEKVSMPVICAPTGFTRMMHSAGEVAVARSAQRLGIPYTLSTMGTTSPESLARATPEVSRWFQLYLWQNRSASRELIGRAREAGFRVLMLTVDTPVAGERLRDVRNGLTVPPKLTFKTLADMAMHPGWWFDLLTTEPLEFASLRNFAGTVAEMVDQMFDPSADIETLEWVKSQWDGPVVVKGIQTVEDARRIVGTGVEGIVVSNHGGRQLDKAPTPLEVLPGVVEAVGSETDVMIDGGVMNGSDVAAAVALGARAVLVGRAYLYGLMAGGEVGVARSLEILRSQLTRTMQLTGATDVPGLAGRVVVGSSDGRLSPKESDRHE
jgi:L-lactate dehydrogenase (cytochrome)